ncbi:unnamed protein product, partial [Lampetra planeri]
NKRRSARLALSVQTRRRGRGPGRLVMVRTLSDGSRLEARDSGEGAMGGREGGGEGAAASTNGTTPS